GAVTLTESFEGVDVTAFMNLTGQLVYSKILESYLSDIFTLSKIVSTIPTRLNGEKIPGTTGIKDANIEIPAGMPYPNMGFSEDYIETPSTTKRGLIVPVTREAVFFDRTHLILSRAAEVGELLALNKEKRIADMITGLSSIYNWKGQSYDTYYAGTGDDPWKNMLVSNELTDVTSVENAISVFSESLDPYTEEPILIEGDTILVMPKKQFTAYEVLRSQEILCVNNVLRTVASPFSRYKIVVSRIAYRQLTKSNPALADDFAKYWYIGNFSKAFAYMENWPITVTQSMSGSEADFSQDIIIRFKASERGTPAVLNPRYVVKCTG
ncbi:MAG: hypothetical protein IKW74_01765, partial [Thermoguttaceae bacterium]|nr:hypothetical protein [Thermoguttaceae bacterium]